MQSINLYSDIALLHQFLMQRSEKADSSLTAYIAGNAR